MVVNIHYALYAVCFVFFTYKCMNICVSHYSFMNQKYKQMQTKTQNVCFLHQSYFIYHHQTTALTAECGWLDNMVATRKTKSLLFMKCYCACCFMYYYNVTISTYMNIQIIHATLTCLLLLTPLHSSACGSWWRTTSCIHNVTVEVIADGEVNL